MPSALKSQSKSLIIVLLTCFEAISAPTSGYLAEPAPSAKLILTTPFKYLHETVFFLYKAIEHLIKVDSSICGDIVNELPLSQPTVSQHLKELKNAGLIKGTVEGNTICYCLNEEGFSKLKIFFDHINTYLEKNKNCNLLLRKFILCYWILPVF